MSTEVVLRLDDWVAVSLRPRAAFIEWINALDGQAPPISLGAAQLEPNVFLLPVVKRDMGKSAVISADVINAGPISKNNKTSALSDCLERHWQSLLNRALAEWGVESSKEQVRYSKATLVKWFHIVQCEMDG